PFWRYVSKFNPLLYFINGVRFGILGHSDVPMPLAIGVSLLSLLIIYVIAWRSLKKASYTRW
ncbi:MAG: ABC transporter permease, partial [Bdellovibrionales bacterium]|nr:ABC transporter permease [Bdellovibrionales bacterium]